MTNDVKFVNVKVRRLRYPGNCFLYSHRVWNLCVRNGCRCRRWTNTVRKREDRRNTTRAGVAEWKKKSKRMRAFSRSVSGFHSFKCELRAMMMAHSRRANRLLSPPPPLLMLTLALCRVNFYKLHLFSRNAVFLFRSHSHCQTTYPLRASVEF